MGDEGLVVVDGAKVCRGKSHTCHPRGLRGIVREKMLT